MAIELKEFHESFFQDVLASADSNAEWTEDAFFEAFCTHLVDAGELETSERIAYAPRKVEFELTATVGIRFSMTVF